MTLIGPDKKEFASTRLKNMWREAEELRGRDTLDEEDITDIQGRIEEFMEDIGLDDSEINELIN